MVVRGIGLIQSVQDIDNIVVTRGQGRAGLREGHRPRPARSRRRRPASSGSTPRPEAWKASCSCGAARTRPRFWQGINEAVDELNESRLPQGVRIVPIYDRTDLVRNTLHTVSHTLLEGLSSSSPCCFCSSGAFGPRCSLR